MNANHTFELNANDVDQVSGGIFPVVIVAAFAAGYVAGRNSK